MNENDKIFCLEKFLKSTFFRTEITKLSVFFLVNDVFQFFISIYRNLFSKFNYKLGII